MVLVRMSSLLLLVVHECLFCTCRSNPYNVTFIGIGAYRYVTAVPAIESAITVINTLYRDTISLKLDLIFPTSIYPCDVFADSIVNYATKFYYDLERVTDDSLKIFIGPSCTPEVVSLAPVMTSLNILYAPFIGAAPAISDKKRFPTTITVSPNHPTVLIQGFRVLLRTFNWTNMFMICQDNPVEPVAFHRMTCQNFRAPRALGAVQVPAIIFNVNRKIDYDGILKQAASAARVILFVATMEITRLFMLEAKRNNMTSDEYVYLCVLPYITSDYFSDLRWAVGDGYDMEAKEAFRQLFLVIYDNNRAVDSLQNETKQFIVQRSASTYNYTYAENELITAPTIAAYETSLMLATAINDSVSTGGLDLHDTKLFTRRFFNKTFHLPTGEIYMNENGDRIPDLLIRQLNQNSGLIEPVMFYTGATQKINNAPGSFPRWINGAPPLGKPLCGYDGLDPVCSKRINLLTNVALPVGLIMLFLVITLFLSRRYYDGSIFNDQWWIMSNENFYFEVMTKSQRYRSSVAAFKSVRNL